MFWTMRLEYSDFLNYLYLTMNEDEDLTIIQTEEDRRQLEKRLLGEFAEDVTNFEMQKNDR